MLDEHLVQECSIITPVRNRYGDYALGTSVDEACRFREISTVQRGVHSELNDSDAMLWLSAETSAVKGSIVLFDGTYYQIERLTKARRLGESDVQFVKCDLKVTDIAIS